MKGREIILPNVSGLTSHETVQLKQESNGIFTLIQDYPEGAKVSISGLYHMPELCYPAKHNSSIITFLV